MFNDFINTNWKNDAINKTNQQIIKLENELNELGKDITLKELLEFIKTNSNFNRLYDNPLSFVKDPNDNYTYNYVNYLKYNEDIEHITNKYEEYKNNMINKIIININNLFEIKNEYKLARFEKLQNYLINEYTQIIKNHFKHIDIWFKSYLEKFKYEYNNGELNKFQEYIMNNFYRYIHCDLSLNDNPLNINDTILSEILIEKDEYKLKRNTLNNSIKTFFENL